MNQTLPYSPERRIYAVEFLRIFFILAIIVGHSLQLVPDFAKSVFSFFKTEGFNINIAVEYFFIMAGFFLYRRVYTGGSVWEQMKRTYLRLEPCLLYAFMLCVVLRTVPFSKCFPAILTLTYGIGLNSQEYIPYGVWFICTYFWVSCLLIALFVKSPQYAWLIIGVCIYICFSMKTHIQLDEDYHTYAYFGIIGSWLIRGIGSMALGMVAGFIAEKLNVKSRYKAQRFIFSVMEGWLLIVVWNSIMNPRHCHADYVGVQVLFMILMISISQSWGYISFLLNNAAKIQKLSRYILPTFIGHIVVMLFLRSHYLFGLQGFSVVGITVGGGIVLGVVEYHIIEQKLWLKCIKGN